MKPNRDSDTYCMLAFHGFHQENGSSCCHMKLGQKYKSFNRLLNSDEHKTIRVQLNNGNRPIQCQKCWDVEKKNIESLRIKQNRKQYEKDSEYNSLLYLSLSTGNICNLACRTCVPEATFQLIREEEKYSELYQTEKISSVVKKYSNFEEIKKEDMSHVKLVEFLGGEPLFDNLHQDILKKVLKENKNCEIYYSTNGSLSVKKYYYKNNLDTVNKLTFGLSIDAIGLPFEYIRTNAKWKTVNKNISDLIDLKKTNKNLNINIHVTISVLNLFYLNELSEWLIKNEFYTPVITFVKYPKYYSFNVINNDIKQKILDNNYFGIFDDHVRKNIEMSIFDPMEFKKLKTRLEFTKNFKRLDYKEYISKIESML